jgi:hypothetical protein
MKAPAIGAVVSLSAILLTGEAGASRELVVEREAAERFIVLPDSVRFPEGITANPGFACRTRTIISREWPKRVGKLEREGIPECPEEPRYVGFPHRDRRIGREEEVSLVAKRR